MAFSNAKPITVYESEKPNQSSSTSNTNRNIKQNTASANSRDRLLKAVENKEIASDDLVKLAVSQMSDGQVNQLLKSAANLKSNRKGKQK